MSEIQGNMERGESLRYYKDLYEIERVKGFKNILFGGEGLFLTKLTGPGKIILQTMNFGDLASRVISRIPAKN